MPTVRRNRTRALNLVLDGPAWDWLCEMFAANIESPFFQKKFMTFKYASDLGFRPWHEALSVLWETKGKGLNTRQERTDKDAWMLLQAYHREYLRLKGTK